MKRSLAIILVLAGVLSAVLAVIGSVMTRPSGAETHALRGSRVVIFTVPGISWEDILDLGGEGFPAAEERLPGVGIDSGVEEDRGLPAFAQLVREGATAALAPRTASVRPSATRGYLTLGAGNRAAASNGSVVAEKAYEKDEEVTEGVSADNAFYTQVGEAHKSAVVHLGLPQLLTRQETQYHGTRVGALGEALWRAGIVRGVVSAADRAHAGVPPETGRGSPVLAIVDEDGGVDRGKIRGLVDPAPGSPFGVATDESALLRAATQLLEKVRVLLIEPGETLRADQFSEQAFPDIARALRQNALRATDQILGSVMRNLGPRDLMLLVGSSSAERSRQEHLTPMIAWGSGVEPGELVSATTRRPGIVTLTDVAPTVLAAVGVDRPASMSGRAMRRVASDVERPLAHDELDDQSVFRERFVPTVFYSFVGLFIILFLLVALVFLFRRPLELPLAAVSYLIIAVPFVAFVTSAVPLWRLGTVRAHLVLWAIALLAAGLSLTVPGPRWTRAVPVFLATAVFVGVVLLLGGHLLVNGVFGNSVLAAGRFYGIPNTGSALFFGAGVLALASLGELWDAASSRFAITIGLLVLLVLIGFPSFGADVGGLLTGVAAAAVTVLTLRGERVAWGKVVVAIVAAVVVTLAVAFLDSLRDPDAQTHLGRFVDELLARDGRAFRTISRKATQSWASLSFSRFTYVVPFGIAALGVLLRRPRGAMRDVMSTHRVIRAALAGLIVAGILGFAVNDSGVAVPALLLGQAVPLVVLLALDHRAGTRVDPAA